MNTTTIDPPETLTGHENPEPQRGQATTLPESEPAQNGSDTGGPPRHDPPNNDQPRKPDPRPPRPPRWKQIILWSLLALVGGSLLFLCHGIIVRHLIDVGGEIEEGWT
jgi:hypothetical protein